MNFEELIQQIENVHKETQKIAVQQVNSFLTIRNILIGFYIVEFEQNGSDRAEYGTDTLKMLAQRLKHIKGVSARQLYRFRNLYNTYPQIFSTVSRKFKDSTFIDQNILPTVSAKFELAEQNDLSFEPELLLSRLSFSHFVELLNADDQLKRSFYEVQTIKNNWSARELGRAMNTMLFERTGLSENKEQVIKNFKADNHFSVDEVVKNPYFLEFIGLEEKYTYSETQLETAIINHLQDFLTELGRGFCFEARQKRITFDNKHFKIDLVFFHRILKCHVLIDLKIGAFDHADAGQMNVYLNYFRKNEMTEGDNPPIGIILCANKNEALVEYATTGLTNEIFVSKYQVQLPSKEVLETFIRNEIALSQTINNKQ
jgi:predicted nuclease of restriction endonuclease-like (RecB) superfamily